MEMKRSAGRNARTGCKLLGLALAGTLGLICGCSSSKEYERLQNITFSAQPPVFLQGPMSALLTNGGGYKARLTVQGDPLAAKDGLSSGQLFCRGSKLLFAPMQKETKKTRSGGFAFMWDVSQAKGYVLSGALEGYAPISSSIRSTNIVSQVKNPSERVDGRAAVLETAVVQMDDGSAGNYQVWRAPDLKGIAVRVTSTAAATPLTLTLSDIKLEPPPEDAFILPDEFTKYSSPEALADEVAARLLNLRRKNTGPLEPAPPSGWKGH
jgi:hypothetical protein